LARPASSITDVQITTVDDFAVFKTGGEIEFGGNEATDAGFRGWNIAVRRAWQKRIPTYKNGNRKDDSARLKISRTFLS